MKKQLENSESFLSNIQIIPLDISSSNFAHDSKPVVIISKTLADIDPETGEVKERLEYTIIDSLKVRIFSCRFMSPNQESAMKLSKSLVKNHNYKIINSNNGNGFWHTHLIKEIVDADIEKLFNTVNSIAKKNSSSLISWNFDADVLPS